MLGLFSGDNTGDLGLGEAVLGLEFLLTFMIVLAYLRVSTVTMMMFVLIFGSDRGSRNHNLCLCVCAVLVCLKKLSIFIFLLKFTSRALREQSNCVIPSEPKILGLVT